MKKNMTLSDFDNELRLLLEERPSHRPFVCEGNPLEYEVFLVGYNPATGMDADFLKFWDEKSGYKKQDWLEKYKEERKRNGKPELSRTRGMIDRISMNVKCLETNLYSFPTPRAKDLKKDQRNSTFFEFLLNSIKPKLVFIHGAKTLKGILKLSDQKDIEKDKFIDLRLSGTQTKIIATKHLSRGWSHEKAIEFGKTLSKHL